MSRRFFPQNRLVQVGIWGGALLLVCLAARLVWRAAGTETGIQTLRAHWWDATLGWVLGSREPIDSRQPAEQAEYWLREVDRVLQAHPNDARLTMGAAVVLDSPGEGYSLSYLKLSGGPPRVIARSGFDSLATKQAEDDFEARCKHRCLQLAAKAAKLDPTNFEWRRLYAILLHRNAMHSADNALRVPDWLGTLDQCARHDPDNALYDYLAADAYWEAAATIEFSGGEMQLVVKDPDAFKRGIERFEQGQAKRCFSVGDAGLTAVADFLSHTQAPLTDQQRTLGSRGIHSRRSLLLRNVWRWQGLRADQQSLAGDVAGALALSRQNLRLVEQFTCDGVSTAYDPFAMASKAGTAWQMHSFANRHKAAMGESERRRIVAFREAVTLEQAIVTRAAQDMANGKTQPTNATALFGGAELTTWLVLDVAASLFVLLLLVGVLATIVCRRLPEAGQPIVGAVGQIVTLAIALSTTVTVFGLAPAEIIGPEIQAWFYTAVVSLTPILAVAWGARYWFYRRRFQFSIRAMLIFTFVASVILLLLSIVWHDARYGSFPFQMSMTARGWNGMHPSVYADAITANYGNWLWAMFQWTAYRGALLTLALWAGLVTALYCRRVWIAHRQAAAPLPGPRKFLGGLFRVIGPPALAMSACLLLAYLLLAPSAVEQNEWEFQETMAFPRDPQSHWREVEKAVQRVRSDATLMSQLRETAKADLARPVDL